MADDKQNYTKTGIDQSHDIVTRLRQYALWLPNTAAGEVCGEAANEIERLCAAGERLNVALLVTSNVWGRQHQSDDDAKYHHMVDVAVDGWGEARRG